MTTTKATNAQNVWDEITRAVTKEIKSVEHLLKEKRRLNELRVQLAAEHFEKQGETGIAVEVAKAFGIRLEHMLSTRRPDHIAFPRQVAMTLMYQSRALDMSLVAVGEFFSKDHGTVIHAIRVVKDRCETDARIRDKVNALRELCGVPEPQIRN